MTYSVIFEARASWGERPGFCFCGVNCLHRPSAARGLHVLTALLTAQFGKGRKSLILGRTQYVAWYA